MDPLTDILIGMQIRAATFTRMDATAPWGVKSPGDSNVSFVLIVRGSTTLTTPSAPQPIVMSSGDVFIKFDDTPYQMFDSERSALIDCIEVEKQRIGNYIQIGGGGALTTFIGGAFELDATQARPLISALPTLLHLKLHQQRSLAFQSVLEMLAMETEEPGLGSNAVISHLFELLFVHAIRAYANQPDGPTQGWLGAIADRNLSRALHSMHECPERTWTVESLASTAGMSRSAFAARFKRVVGQSPLEYLTQWRMYLARRLLQRRDISLTDIAQQVGYESSAAFNRVFRREIGMSPGAFRRSGA